MLAEKIFAANHSKICILHQKAVHHHQHRLHRVIERKLNKTRHLHFEELPQWNSQIYIAIAAVNLSGLLKCTSAAMISWIYIVIWAVNVCICSYNTTDVTLLSYNLYSWGYIWTAPYNICKIKTSPFLGWYIWQGWTLKKTLIQIFVMHFLINAAAPEIGATRASER